MIKRLLINNLITFSIIIISIVFFFYSYFFASVVRTIAEDELIKKGFDPVSYVEEIWYSKIIPTISNDSEEITLNISLNFISLPSVFLQHHLGLVSKLVYKLQCNKFYFFATSLCRISDCMSGISLVLASFFCFLSFVSYI